ncbi:helix-turn-helix transcriptional regulator [Campylobacter sp. VTCC 70190]|uniref:S24 family peptidase n=1 Tax=Campylobacter sp. VTCC 70190 TaxID=3392118 RepID=UPI00398F4E86
MVKGGFNYLLVKNRMKEKKITNQDLADYITRNSPNDKTTTLEAVKTWFRTNDATRTSPELFKLKLIGDFLDLSAEDLLLNFFKNDNQINFNYFPDIYASAGLGTSSQSEEVKIVSVDENFLKEILDIPIKKSYDIIKINGDSMEPILSNGDFIIVDRSKNTLTTISNADIVIFRKDDDLFCKKIKKEPFDDYLFLVSENKKYEDKKVANAEFEQCQILGAVVSKMTIETFKNFIEVAG